MINKKLIEDFLSIKNVKIGNYDELYNSLDRYYQKGKYKIISIKKINKKILNIFNGPYCGVKIDHNLSESYHINFIINNKYNINLYFYKIENLNKKLIIYLINIISYMISLNINNINKNNINIYYYLSEEKKKLSNKEYIYPENVNSGYTYSNNIFIYRLEDIYKVTIHELIHLLNYDKKCHINNNKLINIYNKRYNINIKDIKLYESYTELWANIYHIYFISKFIKKDNNKFFNLLLSIEKEYAIILAQKILSLKLNKNINKYTNVLEYFIIRGEYYLNFDKYQKDLLYILNNGDLDCIFNQKLDKIKINKDIIKKLKNYKELYESLSMILIRLQPS